ncbi:alanine racemase [Falsarthrobacter nasiphocae]|uniref:Alanine racemase n=1 Tax=Falsarthrobacter nasiphocae TaxID=189863 RepID=A0AAE3YG58_9MICC|nr:alanine racemase [Falsarthrobacter nasiphocae]MDR6892560.1 alanine racemase [Falsarthrobacter nasiphocae]
MRDAYGTVTMLPERAATVDLGALVSNARSIAARIAPSRLMTVLKADAYGHGAAAAGRALAGAGFRDFGVAHVSEALELREAVGPEPRILAWLHTSATDFAAALRAGIELGVNGSELDAILEAARATGCTPRLHAIVDTGLGRNGAVSETWDAFFARLAELSASGRAVVVGIMSHLAVADEPGRPETDLQRQAFERAVETAGRHGLSPLQRHLANTPASLVREDLRYEMCRVGLGLYGLSPFSDRAAEEFGLRPVMTLSTRVSLVKRVEEGHGASYGLLWTAPTPTHLGLVPLGYADGIPRVAEGLRVRIGGVDQPVVGRIAMDQMIVDLGADESAMDLLGADAVVFGAGGQPVEDVAAAAGTINYEIVTRISPRVERVWTEPEGLGALVGPSGSRVFAAETAEEMRALGARLGQVLEPGDVLVLTGDLGAGKTTLTQGIAEGLGVSGRVTSPTFVLARVHPNDPEGPRPGGPDLVHVDAYRLGDEGGLDGLALEDTAHSSVTVVEWGEHLPAGLGTRTVRVRIGRAGAPDTVTEADGTLDFGSDDAAADPRTISVSLDAPAAAAGREESQND